MPVLEAVPGTPQTDSLDSGDTHDCGHNHENDNHNHGNSQLVLGGNSQSVLGNQEYHMKYERYRLESFMSWPLYQNVDKHDLARNGFYYIGDGTDDRVRCAFCKIILKRWEIGDVVEDEHRRIAPLCPFVCDHANLGNFPQAYRQLPSNNVHHRGPLHREYSDRELRLKSFYNWPQDQRPTPGELANAGFFYLGVGDSVKCFYCGVALQHWEENEDVWTEHKKWFPLCLFVAEHDPSTHSELAHHLRRTISGIAIANGYAEEIIESFRKYIDEHELIQPEDYRELVNQLDQYIQSLSGVTVTGATGTIQDEMSVQQQSNPSEEQKETVQDEMSVQQQSTPSEEQKETVQDEMSVQQQSTPSEEQKETFDRYICKLCYENSVEVIFNPCRHVCCCKECSDKVSNCPVCRTRIRGKLPLFFS